MKEFSSVAIFLLCAFAALASAQQNDTATTQPALAAPEEFVVFPWDIIKPGKAAYEEARECGFNLAGFVAVENLDLVRDAGLKCFVSDASIKVRGNEELSDDEIAARVKKLAAQTADHPAVFGYHIVDEPARKLLPTVIKWANAVAAAAPQKIAYTNFFPIGSVDIGPTAADYEDYLKQYVNGAKPKAFSFDHYSMMDDGSVRPNYFECIEVVRKVSVDTKTPFWHVALANAHFRYAEPSAATFRFQVFTSLAYGARGIGWFTYTSRDRGNYRSSAIDLAGRRTSTWPLLRDANLQAHRLAPTITKLKSVNVFHHPDVPKGCRGLSDSRYVADIKGAGPFCVGEFEDEQGRPALVVVNRDLKRSTTYDIKLKTASPIHRVSSLTGVVRPLGAEDNWLEPGGGILLLLRP